MSVMNHEEVNMRKERGKCKESEEVGLKWTEKKG